MSADILRERTVVFDLDDTLYAERDYVRSGVAAVLALVRQLYHADIAMKDLPPAGAIDEICRRAGLAEPVRDALLWHYRLHWPAIMLRPGVRETIAGCRKRREAVCILTDGRSTSQRLKLGALEVDYDDAFISEELGHEKPCHLGFARVEAAWPASTYIYVADNPAKDFIAPNARGWRTIGLRADAQAIHRLSDADLPPEAQPGAWAKDFAEIDALLAQGV